MKLTIDIDINHSNLLATYNERAKKHYWFYNQSSLFDKEMLVAITEENQQVQYIAICHPDNFILDQIEKTHKNAYIHNTLLKKLRNQICCFKGKIKEKTKCLTNCLY